MRRHWRHWKASFNGGAFAGTAFLGSIMSLIGVVFTVVVYIFHTVMEQD
jgi:uncharacterized membrane protein